MDAVEDAQIEATSDEAEKTKKERHLQEILCLRHVQFALTILVDRVLTPDSRP